MSPKVSDTGVLELQQFLIKERVAPLKTAATYDILDPETGERCGLAREADTGFPRLLRWILSKNEIEVRETEDESLVFTIRKPMSFWSGRVEVCDAENGLVGYFQSRLFSWGRGFWIYDCGDQQFAEIKGDLSRLNFSFVSSDGHELGLVTKQWAGLGRELFTSANDYIVSLHDELADQPLAKMLLLGAALAIDLFYRDR